MPVYLRKQLSHEFCPRRLCGTQRQQTARHKRDQLLHCRGRWFRDNLHELRCAGNRLGPRNVGDGRGGHAEEARKRIEMGLTGHGEKDRVGVGRCHAASELKPPRGKPRGIHRIQPSTLSSIGNLVVEAWST